MVYNTTIDQVGCKERVYRIFSRSIKKESKVWALNTILSMIDLTTLEGRDSSGKVKQLCYKAAHLHDKHPGLPKVAAICVYPSMVAIAKKSLERTNIKTASVATGFPSGMTNLNSKIEEVKFVVEEGAEEVDMVISRGKFLAGEHAFVFDEIAAIKEVCGTSRLKVILETGELTTLDNVRRASDIAIYAGADFIKTSTGKIQPAATLQVTYTMLQAIRDYYDDTGKMVGMKPAGGISNSKLALHNLVMVKEVLGEDWLTNQWFRFGASSLANDVLMQILKTESGIYQSADYFTLD